MAIKMLFWLEMRGGAVSFVSYSRYSLCDRALKSIYPDVLYKVYQVTDLQAIKTPVL